MPSGPFLVPGKILDLAAGSDRLGGGNQSVPNRTASRGEPASRRERPSDAVAELVSLMYEAAHDETRWPEVLRRIRRACAADGAAVHLSIRPPDRRLVMADGIAQGDVERYERAELLGSSLQRQCESEDSAATGPWLAVPVPVDTVEYARLVVRVKKPDRVSPERRRKLLQRLAPPLAGALRIAIRTAEEALHGLTQQCESDAYPLGRILLDAAGGVLHVNRVARGILDAGDGLLVAQGRLTAIRADDNALLRQAVQTCIGAGAGGERALAIHRRHGRSPYVIRVAALFLGVRPSIFTRGAPVAEVIVMDRHRAPPDMSFAAASWPELSRVERRVLERLLLGDSLAQCAQQIGIARSTAKLHVEHIFRKTGARSQAELVRLALLPFVAVPPG